MNRKTALYCRAAHAPKCDDVAEILQKERLRRYAELQGYTDTRLYEDIGFSGTKLDGRPAFDRLMRDINAGEVKRVVVQSFGRIGRNTAEVIRWIGGLHARDVDVAVLECPADSFDTLQRLFGTWMETPTELAAHSPLTAAD
jgi:DNA invertase Pin-like site-specific DNA recombinase